MFLLDRCDQCNTSLNLLSPDLKFSAQFTAGSPPRSPGPSRTPLVPLTNRSFPSPFLAPRVSPCRCAALPARGRDASVCGGARWRHLGRAEAEGWGAGCANGAPLPVHLCVTACCCCLYCCRLKELALLRVRCGTCCLHCVSGRACLGCCDTCCLLAADFRDVQGAACVAPLVLMARILNGYHMSFCQPHQSLPLAPPLLPLAPQAYMLRATALLPHTRYSSTEWRSHNQFSSHQVLGGRAAKRGARLTVWLLWRQPACDKLTWEIAAAACTCMSLQRNCCCCCCCCRLLSTRRPVPSCCDVRCACAGVCDFLQGHGCDHFGAHSGAALEQPGRVCAER